ncbi:hypothetical protein [Pseudomonas trivialis]|uniref:hypothetical protein n=1 Tax=Pseudomonas trivialis TaxID=200450 RepID=UPI001112D5EB|nr:hypothetical protein [Pseudomonas trivialis]
MDQDIKHEYSSIPVVYQRRFPEYLRIHDNSSFTEQQLSTFNEQALATVKQQQDYIDAHPSVAIYRLATQGSQTRNERALVSDHLKVEVLFISTNIEERTNNEGKTFHWPG